MNAAPTTPPSPMPPNAAVIGSSALLEHKTCGHCKKRKPRSDFHSNKSQPDGLHHYCKPCKNEADARSARKHKAARKKRFAQWYLRNADRVRAKAQLQYRRNPKAWNAAAAARHRASGYKHQKAYAHRTCVEGNGFYIKKLIKGRSKLSAAIIPESLVRAKQANLKLKRTICNLQKT